MNSLEILNYVCTTQPIIPPEGLACSKTRSGKQHGVFKERDDFGRTGHYSADMVGSVFMLPAMLVTRTRK